MTNFGKLSLDGNETDIIYSIDPQTQLVEITHIDENGRKFLTGLTLGDKMILKHQDSGQVNLIVRGLTISNHVACQASIEKE